MVLLFLVDGFQPDRLPAALGPEGVLGTKVATNIMGGAPVIGPYLPEVLVGGTDYGNQTVTRFYGLHVAILPTLLVLCLVAHIVLSRRHGITPPPRRRAVAGGQVLARTGLPEHGLLRGRGRR